MWLALLATNPTAQIQSANNTEKLAIITISLTAVGGAITAAVSALVTGVVGKGRWAKEAAGDTATGETQDQFQSDLTKLRIETEIAAGVTAEFRAEHSMSDRELDRHFATIENRLTRIEGHLP